MKVLIACEYSGKVRDAFRRRGHDAVSCDLLDTEVAGPHVVGDVLPLLKERWDLVIAHPPCQFLANSGIRWLYKGGKKVNGEDPERWESMRTAAQFFSAMWEANTDRHPHGKKALRALGVPIDDAYIVQPWMFVEDDDDVDNVTKGAYLLTRGLPRLTGNGILDGSTARPEAWLMSPSKTRWKDRSRTRTAVAEAMAEQWGSL